MSTNERNTHFAGFAQAVRREEQNKACGIGLHDWTPTLAEKTGRDVVARRVYDLVVHILMHAPTSSLQHCCSRLEAESCIADIPDLPKLPEVES